MSKYIDADKLVAGLKHLQERFEFSTYEAIYHLIESLQQEQLKGVEGVVHHALNCHYVKAKKKQLDALLNQFDEGAEVMIYISARKEESK